MDTNKTHWKKLTNPNYLGAYSLSDMESDLIVEITSVAKELVHSPDGTKQECIVAQLKGQKPIILCKTNCKTIAKIYDTPFIENWKGKKISLYVAKVKAFGEMVEALRVRPNQPSVPIKPELTPASDAWESAKKAVASGDYTIQQIQSKYTITEANILELTK